MPTLAILPMFLNSPTRVSREQIRSTPGMSTGIWKINGPCFRSPSHRVHTPRLLGFPIGQFCSSLVTGFSPLPNRWSCSVEVVVISTIFYTIPLYCFFVAHFPKLASLRTSSLSRRFILVSFTPVSKFGIHSRWPLSQPGHASGHRNCPLVTKIGYHRIRVKSREPQEFFVPDTQMGPYSPHSLFSPLQIFLLAALSPKFSATPTSNLPYNSVVRLYDS